MGDLITDCKLGPTKLPLRDRRWHNGGRLGASVIIDPNTVRWNSGASAARHQKEKKALARLTSAGSSGCWTSTDVLESLTPAAAPRPAELALPLCPCEPRGERRTGARKLGLHEPRRPARPTAGAMVRPKPCGEDWLEGRIEVSPEFIRDSSAQREEGMPLMETHESSSVREDKSPLPEVRTSPCAGG